MSQMEIDSVLAQIRALSAQARPSATPVAGAAQSGPSAFASLMSKGLEAVNETQQRAGQMQDAFQRGDPNVDLSQVMIQMQKANVAFRAVTEVRNRLVSAYQEIMNMQV